MKACACCGRDYSGPAFGPSDCEVCSDCWLVAGSYRRARFLSFGPAEGDEVLIPQGYIDLPDGHPWTGVAQQVDRKGRTAQVLVSRNGHYSQFEWRWDELNRENTGLMTPRVDRAREGADP